eukprot:10664255-Lingulodinium_polyedra.AAC.1
MPRAKALDASPQAGSSPVAAPKRRRPSENNATEALGTFVCRQRATNFEERLVAVVESLRATPHLLED